MIAVLLLLFLIMRAMLRMTMTTGVLRGMLAFLSCN